MAAWLDGPQSIPLGAGVEGEKDRKLPVYCLCGPTRSCRCDPPYTRYFLRLLIPSAHAARDAEVASTSPDYPAASATSGMNDLTPEAGR